MLLRRKRTRNVTQPAVMSNDMLKDLYEKKREKVF